MNPYDEVLKKPAQIQGTTCGENRYDQVEKTLQFYLTPNCSIWIEGVDVIQTNLRLNWTIEAFEENGGVD
jgi:hypothetical protein